MCCVAVFFATMTVGAAPVDASPVRPDRLAAGPLLAITSAEHGVARMVRANKPPDCMQFRGFMEAAATADHVRQ